MKYTQVPNQTVPERAAARENKDCTVRAVMSAIGISYLNAHSLAAQAGRTPRKGFWSTYILMKAKAGGFIKDFNSASMYDNDRFRKNGHYHYAQRTSPYPTLAQAMPLMSTGRYIVETRNHAFAVVDGIIYDGMTDKPRLRQRVATIIEITK